MTEPITTAAEAVAELGALPMPVGADPIAVGRGLDLLALMDERAASEVSPVLAGVLDEAERLRARVAELESALAAVEQRASASLSAAKQLLRRDRAGGDA